MNATSHVQDMYKCSPREVRDFLVWTIQSGQVPFVRSSPGAGKSSLVKSVAEEFGLYLLDERLSTRSPVDMSGFPHIEEGRASFVPFDNFPIEGTPLPRLADGSEANGWLLFLDEFNSAPKSVQAAAYKLVLDRMVGLHKLHPNVVIACAGNLATDRAITNDLSTAMQSRVIHIEMEVSFTDWLHDVAFKQGYDKRIIGFLNWKNEYLMDFRPDHQEHTFCCPRTWQFMNNLLTSYDEHGNKVARAIRPVDIKLFAGTITSGVAAEFVNYCEVYKDLPTLQEITRSPKTARLPDDPGPRWGVVSMLLEKVTPQNFPDIAPYIDRLDSNFRILFYRFIMATHPSLKGTPEFARAMTELSRYLHD